MRKIPITTTEEIGMFGDKHIFPLNTGFVRAMVVEHGMHLRHAVTKNCGVTCVT